MVGYLFFSSDKQLNPPELLLMCIRNATAQLDNIVVVTSPSFIKSLQEHFPHVHFFSESLFPVSPQETKYIQLINQGIIASNHPPTELLCIRRWTALKYLFDNDLIDSREICINLDWDTLLFPPVKDLQEHLIAGWRHYSGYPLLACFQKMGIKGSALESKYLLYEICPNLLFLNSKSIDLYVEYLDKTLSRRGFLLTCFSGRFFNDMSIWSLVTSDLTIYCPDQCLIDIDTIAYQYNLFCDHNLRVNYQGLPATFKMQSYSIPREYDYTGTGCIQLKTIDFSTECPQVETNNGQRLMLVCAHFQGIEAKYILSNSDQFASLRF